MYGLEGIFQMIFYLLMAVAVLGGILSKTKIPCVKIMLLGIGIIVFSSAVLKDKMQYGIDDLISLVGLSLCIVGFILDDNSRL
ncbi:hypothetical protein IAI10_20535 [Clostridium sp. 19966]|uniref:hypothetical protein n=1 Tax=Clostridium sp. 19966 TaxID=2768166 RepID=UPI0028E096BE|nr:hypothetical protein [Clostridium sp. 19966]MDT8719040.1 hypothetical protein [Clostridium sp. 19966]